MDSEKGETNVPADEPSAGVPIWRSDDEYVVEKVVDRRFV